MAKQATLKQRMQYMFDNVMAAGTPAMIGMLVLFSLVIIVVAGVIISIAGISQDGEPLTFSEAAWEAMMRTLDAGTMGGDTGFGYRLVMFAVTIGGVFIVSSLIGVLSSGVESKLEELRKGRSVVLENKHTVILGWSPHVFTIITELVEANSNQKNAAIAILADKDKVEMEDEIRARVPETKTTRVICRSGSPIDPTDLAIVSLHDARSIIVLPAEDDDPDSFVIKTILAITNDPNRREAPYTIVTQLHDEQNLSVVRMIGQRDNVSALLTSELIARVTAQTSRQSGLSVVYTELLDFGGDEIYFKKEDTITGKTFGDVLNAYATSTVIGIFTADGKTMLNPPMDTKMGAGDKLVVIAADDDAIHLNSEKPAVVESSIVTAKSAATSAPERGLILDWNASAPTIIRELDNYVAKGSTVTVVADESFEGEAQSLGELANQQLIFQAGNTTNRQLLDGLNIQDYDHVIVLADTNLGTQKADARTLVTLLHLRDIAEKDETPFSIVSEMLDLRNRKLAEVANVDDFIVSDHLISLMVTQLSENSDLHDVFTDLFDPEGSEIYLKPATDYVMTGQAVNFFTITEAARRRGETALGYRITAEARDQSKSYGVRTNPKKSDMVTFAPEDKVIVLSEG